MPLPIAHSLLGASIVAGVNPQPNQRCYMPLLVGALLANAADFDFFLVFAFHSKTWHRGFSHSILLALVLCLIFVLALGRRHFRAAIAYGLAFASHAILDYVTTKDGGGLELLWPFSSNRFILGLVGLSEVPSKLPGIGILKALIVEFLIFTPLFLLVVALRKYLWKDTRTPEAAI
jgi:membrane-bound metal-dependent hydrolase YbcI (DUF457 family)